MSPEAYRDVITRLGFASINEAGRWLRVKEATGRTYATDGPTPPVVILLELMLALDMTPAEVDQRIRAWKASGR